MTPSHVAVDSLYQCRQVRNAHRKWIEEHGGNLGGYILRYGAASDPDHYGDGGAAIYAADKAALASAQRKLDEVMGALL